MDGLDSSDDRSVDALLMESQPSQLLQQALGGGQQINGSPSTTPIGSNGPHSSSGNKIYDGAIGDSAHSRPDSDSTDSMPKYHFHGLAASQTQTESQYEEVNTGSQKENTPASSNNANLPSAPTPAVAPLRGSKPPSSNDLGTRKTDNGKASHFKPLSTRPLQEASGPFKVPNQKGVSFLSTATVPPSKHKTPQRTRRSPSPSASQDSFAGPSAYQDPDLFLASSRQFAIPLSELGQHSGTEDESTALSSAHNAPHSQKLKGESGRMYAFPPDTRKYASTSSPPRQFQRHDHGRVLVQATPSNSSNSQSSSIPSQPSQGQYQIASQDQAISSRQPDNPYDYELEFPPNLPVLTNATESQGSSQLTDHSAPAPVEDVIDQATQPNDEESFVPPSTIGAGGDSNPRSLINSVNPEKRHRYYPHLAPVRGSTSTSTPTRGEVIPETQPSDNPPGNREDSHGNVVPQETQYDEAPSPPRPARGRKADMSEIIPDSEPPRVSDTVETRREAQQSRGKGKEKERVEEVVPDSYSADEEEEEEVPLAKVTSKRLGKQKEVKAPVSRKETDNQAKRKKSALPSSVVPSDVKKAKSAKSQAPKTQVTTEIPSSEPQQDLKATIRARGPVHAAPKSKSGAKVASGSKQKAFGSSSTRRAEETPAPTEEMFSDTQGSEDEDEDEDGQDGSVKIPEKEEEEETEIADNEDMDIDEPEPSRKRKRQVLTAKPSGRNTRAATKGSTPPPRAVKRLKTAASKSILAGSKSSFTVERHPTRVFALWKGDGHYYSATVHTWLGDINYIVKFDDNTTQPVDLQDMRLCKLHVGDDVLLLPEGGKGKATPAKIVEVVEEKLKIRLETGAKIVMMDVMMPEIKVATKSIQKWWGDRTVTTDDLVPMMKPLKKTPTPSKASIYSDRTGKSAQTLIFENTGFVVTLSAGNNNWEKLKNKVMHDIKSNGGVVLDDWSSIFSMTGTHSHMNKRWTIRKEEVKCLEVEGVEKVFLLADSHNKKPKFLIALGLGIPCLSIKWLEDCIEKKEQNSWGPYLLPAGFSEPLSTRVSQLVDLDWGSSVDHLSEIMTNPNPVAMKLFDGMAILCVGADFFPVPVNGKGKKSVLDAEKNREASRAVPRIILSMGAALVEAVPDMRSASDTEFNYVVVKDEDELAKVRPTRAGDDEEEEGTVYVHLPWVKECLMAGRMLPLPR